MIDGVTRTQEEWNREADRVLQKLRAHDAQKAARGQARPAAPAEPAASYVNPWGRTIHGGVAETRKAVEASDASTGMRPFQRRTQTKETHR